jgi:hypothetical protein
LKVVRLLYKLILGMIPVSAMLLGQGAPAPDASGKESKGIPARANPTDYQAHAQAGMFTIGAEFTGHSVATAEALLTTEEYIVVEVGLFGPADANLKLAHENFSIRINGKKMPSPADPYAAVFQSLKDPEWVPPGGLEPKSKTGGLSSGGKSGDDPPPLPPKVPVELKRLMAQRVQKVALPEGDRPLPVAGLIFFQHGGKVQGIRSLELIYDGPAGKATLTLQP